MSEQNTPDEIVAIGRLIVTQDNRITDAPMFIVQEQKRTYGFDPEYSDKAAWLDCEGDEVDAEVEVAAAASSVVVEGDDDDDGYGHHHPCWRGARVPYVHVRIRNWRANSTAPGRPGAPRRARGRDRGRGSHRVRPQRRGA